MTEDSDFLVSDNTDFHPTDVIEDADGSLLVVDTGGWYKLCCPSSQLVKADVLGAIYRVRKDGCKQYETPRGLEARLGETSTTDVAKRSYTVAPNSADRTQVDRTGRRGGDDVVAVDHRCRSCDGIAATVVASNPGDASRRV